MSQLGDAQQDEDLGVGIRTVVMTTSGIGGYASPLEAAQLAPSRTPASVW